MSVKDFTPLGGGFELQLRFLCSHSPQPAQLGQETTLHGVTATEDTQRQAAHSGKYDTPPAKNYFEGTSHGSFVRCTGKGTKIRVDYTDDVFMLHGQPWLVGYAKRRMRMNHLIDRKILE